MSLRMIDFKCPSCGEEFEELVETNQGISDPENCPKCGTKAPMIMDIDKRIHRSGNRYRDVSWSTWSI